MRTEPIRFSIITLAELEAGVVADSALTVLRRRRLERLVSTIDIVPFDRACMSAYGQILAAVGYSRRKTLDRMIAATALVHDLTLVTINAPDFRDAPGLRIEDWGDAAG